MQPPPIPSKDAEHLRTLAICHYVVSGLSLFGIAFLLLHYAIMNTVFANPKMWENAKEPPPFNPAEFMHLMQWFYLFFGVMIVLGGVATLMSGRFIHRRVNRTFSIVVAGLNCLCFPFGTVLGVFTLIVLTKESVMRLYAEAQSGSAAAA
ncbi:hypothetical protein [Prosthecobacter sp.]|uniref:hypothetical protein n=1 Tax=Prosthecobacter sp. TaxID=1965333 RepID=UPI002ABC5988|nr:hypothetical protein [Prosthecobacter sp.]MDZ4403017.1 hypothetical protein [Prosthecobacter sp.]